VLWAAYEDALKGDLKPGVRGKRPSWPGTRRPRAREGRRGRHENAGATEPRRKPDD